MPLTTFPNPTNITNVTGLFGYSNQVTGNLFMPIMLITLWLIFFVTLKSWRNEAAFGASTFTIMLITILLRIITWNGVPLVNDTVVVIMILCFLAAFFMVAFNKEGYG